MITMENFSSNNRSKTIGNSLYRICREHNNNGKWYIFEMFNNKDTFAQGKGFYNDKLEEVINKFNQITKEKEVINVKNNNI